MYAKAEVRGKGVATALLQHLEAEARDAGITLMRVETGNLQPEAMRLYERAGYRQCGRLRALCRDAGAGDRDQRVLRETAGAISTKEPPDCPRRLFIVSGAA